jgi:uncharacterized protein YwbE
VTCGHRGDPVWCLVEGMWRNEAFQRRTPTTRSYSQRFIVMIMLLTVLLNNVHDVIGKCCHSALTAIALPRSHAHAHGDGVQLVGGRVGLV